MNLKVKMVKMSGACNSHRKLIIFFFFTWKKPWLGISFFCSPSVENAYSWMKHSGFLTANVLVKCT